MSDEQNIQRLIEINTRRLQKLKEQQALKGINTDPALLIEIEDLEQELAQLRAQLGQTKPAPAEAPAPTPAAFPERRTATPSEPKATKEANGGTNWWIPIVVALIGLAGVIFAAVWSGGNNGGEPPEPFPPEEFTYQVRVQTADTGDRIPNAMVIIEVGGRAPLDAVTDSNGIARIFIDASYAGRPGFLIVEREGFHPHTQNIDLVVDALPDVVPLEPGP